MASILDTCAGVGPSEVPPGLDFGLKLAQCMASEATLRDADRCHLASRIEALQLGGLMQTTLEPDGLPTHKYATGQQLLFGGFCCVSLGLSSDGPDRLRVLTVRGLVADVDMHHIDKTGPEQPQLTEGCAVILVGLVRSSELNRKTGRLGLYETLRNRWRVAVDMDPAQAVNTVLVSSKNLITKQTGGGSFDGDYAQMSLTFKGSLYKLQSCPDVVGLTRWLINAERAHLEDCMSQEETRLSERDVGCILRAQHLTIFLQRVVNLTPVTFSHGVSSYFSLHTKDGFLSEASDQAFKLRRSVWKSSLGHFRSALLVKGHDTFWEYLSSGGDVLDQLLQHALCPVTRFASLMKLTRSYLGQSGPYWEAAQLTYRHASSCLSLVYESLQDSSHYSVILDLIGEYIVCTLRLADRLPAEGDAASSLYAVVVELVDTHFPCGTYKLSKFQAMYGMGDVALKQGHVQNAKRAAIRMSLALATDSELATSATSLRSGPIAASKDCRGRGRGR